jgi:potassium efflux system protein
MIRIVRTLLVLAAVGCSLLNGRAVSSQPAATAPAVNEPAATAPPSAAAAPDSATPAPAPPASASVAETNVAPTPAESASPAPAAGGADNETVAEEAIAIDPKAKADLEQRLKSLDSAGLNDEDKAKAVAFYQQAIESFDVATQQLAAAENLKKQIDAIPEETKTYTERLASPLPELTDISGETLAAVESRASKAEVSLNHCRAQLALWVAEPKRRAQRLSEMPKQLADAQQRLKELKEQLESLGSEEVGDVTAMARRAALSQAKAAALATIQSLQREQLLYADSAQLIKIRREYYARYVPHKESRLAMLNDIIAERRQNDAANQVAAAANAVEDAKKKSSRAPIIGQLAAENKELAEERINVVEQLAAVSKQSKEIDAELRDLTEKFAKAQENDKIDELSTISGQLLREQQAQLPNLRLLRRKIASREEQRSSVLLRHSHLSDQQSKLSNLTELADKLAAEAGDLSDETRGEIRKLLERQRELLEQLADNYLECSNKLALLHTNEAQLIAATQQYAGFIAERVLWIPSCPALSRATLAPALSAAQWSLDPTHWKEAGRTILQNARQKPAQSSLFILGIIVLAAAQRPARRRLRELGEEAAKRSCVRLRPTFDALWLTIVLALLWPTLLALLGWTMDSLNSSEFVRSLSAALRFAAVCLLLIELTRHLCRRDGLADAHYDWSDACLHHLRRRMLWLAAVALPLVLWLVGLETQQQEPTSVSALWSPSLGRVLFIGVMLVLAKFLHRTLLAKKSPFRQLNLMGSGLLKPLQVVWRPAVTLLPAILAVMAAIGYYYTAQQAAIRILQTFVMLLAVATLGGFTRRWLLVNRRRLAREQAKQRRAAMALAAETEPEAPPAPEAIEELVDLAALSEQTQKLLRMFLAATSIIGLGLIWAPILPALAYPAEKLLPGAEHLTWGMLAMFLIILSVTYVAVRDIPALLELAILQHLPLDSGSRYAITTLCRYVLTAVGLISACNAVELKWSSIQWLVAAMSVGLGFGLQEIFANFVSGIILLFERPIRVGDIVTLGDKSGTVNRIRMRATTIIDWEKKEYIVPNKDLMTDRLLNWTLTDHMNRIAVSLGVAYGSDTDLACQLLLESAREQPHVLTDPGPVAFFDGFGESALSLKLFCFLPNLENRTATIHQLHSTIARKFLEAGLDIPFPQRDLNVRFDREKISIDLEGKNVIVGHVSQRPASTASQQGGGKQQGAA